MELIEAPPANAARDNATNQCSLSAPAFPALPSDFMSQLQRMMKDVVRAEMKPVYEELEHLKTVVDEESDMRAEAVGDSEEEDVYDDDKALAQLAAAPASTAATATAAAPLHL